MKIRIFGHTMPAITFLVNACLILVAITFVTVVKIFIWSNKEDADIRLGQFFVIVLKALPDEDLNNIVTHGKFLEMYRHRQRDVRRIIKEVVRFGEMNFSNEGKKILNSKVVQFLETIEKDFKPSHALSIKTAMNMHAYEIFRHYILFSVGNEPQKKSYISFVFDTILYIPTVMFFYSPSNLAVILNICSVIAHICIFQLFERRNTPFSIAHVSLHWIMTLLLTAFSPYYIFRRALKNWFWWPPVSLLFFAMVGLWIVQKIWTQTDYEQRNVNTFIAHSKILFIMRIKS